MAAVVFLSQTAVILTERSSSHPCGVRVESPNLFAALLDLVACGRPGLHSAAVVVSMYMLYSYDIVVRVSDASPLYIFEFNISCSTPLTFLHPSLVPFLH